jgi:nucleoside 2-deoxyribosyltransferase
MGLGAGRDQRTGARGFSTARRTRSLLALGGDKKQLERRQPMLKIFISYSHKDRNFVKQLVADLQALLPEVAIFFDMLLPAGSSWAETLANEIESADVILAVLSPDYLTSSWAQQEVNVAIERSFEGGVRLIPLLVRPCTPTGFLASITWVDFTQDYEAALARLIWGITGERPQAAKGKEPGVQSSTINPRELAALRKEVQEAVRLFRSQDEGAQVRQREPSTPNSRRCFIVMPFNDPDLEVVYEYFVKPTIEERCELYCERGDDVFGSNAIMDDILHSIQQADIIVADLTRKNANVFYEIGICHTLKKSVLLLAQSIEEVPFDLRHRRVLLYEYSPKGCKILEGKLKENLMAILAEQKKGRRSRPTQRSTGRKPHKRGSAG